MPSGQHLLPTTAAWRGAAGSRPALWAAAPAGRAEPQLLQGRASNARTEGHAPSSWPATFESATMIAEAEGRLRNRSRPQEIQDARAAARAGLWLRSAPSCREGRWRTAGGARGVGGPQLAGRGGRRSWGAEAAAPGAGGPRLAGWGGRRSRGGEARGHRAGGSQLPEQQAAA